MIATLIESSANLPCMLLATAISSFFLHYYTKHKGVLLNLPVVGLLPEVFFNFHGLQDKVTKLLEEKKCTFFLKGAFLAQSDILITSDPANVHHIMSSNFSNYAKGSNYRKRFDIFGDDSIFNADFQVWQHNRKIARGFLSHHQFHQLLNTIVPDAIENGLIPVLDHLVSGQNLVVDLQDLFKRFTFDFASLIVLGSNPKSLSVGFPENIFTKALDDACEATCARHLVPDSFWRLQRWLVVGKERKLSESWKTIDRFCADHIAIKRKKLELSNEDDQEEGFDILNCYLTGHEITGPTPTDKIIRDNITLFPPVPSQLRVPIQPDTLPSGHHVDENTNIMISLYAMARMVSVWGEDCCEFKPERWITEDGKIKHEPAHKFFSFNAWPRICIGKDIALTMMKGVVATMMRNYSVQVVESHPVLPNLSSVFSMKHGLMVTVNKRWD
ncbi:hypothetical protein Dsin_014065 [Dipteronia sinensis]|uniref:Cytochrome P450 n=1 Tax=Dipteronia sinensis TaxID=43782 RepID=A0AAE0AM47_9ROSI|nr:hypothetical protein Dsin_014065 [Dipteronia sinensis]